MQREFSRQPPPGPAPAAAPGQMPAAAQAGFQQTDCFYRCLLAPCGRCGLQGWPCALLGFCHSSMLLVVAAPVSARTVLLTASGWPARLPPPAAGRRLSDNPTVFLQEDCQTTCPICMQMSVKISCEAAGPFGMVGVIEKTMVAQVCKRV